MDNIHPGYWFNRVNQLEAEVNDLLKQVNELLKENELMREKLEWIYNQGKTAESPKCDVDWYAEQAPLKALEVL